MKEENETAEKFNKHHIRPCCTFKDETHKNRSQTKPLADKFNGNLIKLSIYNHFFAHYYLWKIFDNFDLKTAFQRMCCDNKIYNLTDDELNEIAILKQNCTKKNQTKDERKKKDKEYKDSNKEKISKYNKKHYILNKNKILNDKKEYRKQNKEKISDYFSRLCYDPKKENTCKLSTLYTRKYRHSELYKDVVPLNCLI